MRALLVLLALLFAPTAALAQAAGTVLVAPIAGAPAPLDANIARSVAEALLDIGYQATSGATEGPVVKLAGKATATRTPSGARFEIVFVFTSSGGVTLTPFRSTATAPYDAQNPWDALDADTLGKFAAQIALDAEKTLMEADKKGMQATGPKSSPVGDANLLGGTARVFIKGVTGAPGDGNLALANALAQFFAQFDVELLPAGTPDAYLIEGRVRVTPSGANEETVEILWLLRTMSGKEIARITQDKKVAKGSLSPNWGQAATYAAEGAADGLLSVISQLGPTPPLR